MHLKDFVSSRHGAAQQLANTLKVSGSLVVQWAAGKPVALERCAQIERATSGAVACEELRPDGSWHRVPDAAWPWHPKGRPLLDLGRSVAQAA